jgi:hygromycin-B 7''-O-kinase
MNDIYLQPDAPDAVLDDETVLELARRHVPEARAVKGIDESGGEARTYAIDDDLVLKVQRPHRLRPRTSLEKEVFFLNQLAADSSIRVPRVLGYGREGSTLEYICMTRLPGIAFAHAQLDPAARREALFALGAMLRRIHRRPQEPFVQSGLFPDDRDTAGFKARLAGYSERWVQGIRRDGVAWPLSLSPKEVQARALAAIPETEERVALHANPSLPHVFVDPITGRFSGLIDFGDAYVSHPALDLWAWRLPADRAAVLAGYTSEAPVSAAFMATWRAVMILRALILIAARPEQAAEAAADLESLLAEL